MKKGGSFKNSKFKITADLLGVCNEERKIFGKFKTQIKKHEAREAEESIV